MSCCSDVSLKIFESSHPTYKTAVNSSCNIWRLRPFRLVSFKEYLYLVFVLLYCCWSSSLFDKLLSLDGGSCLIPGSIGTFSVSLSGWTDSLTWDQRPSGKKIGLLIYFVITALPSRNKTEHWAESRMLVGSRNPLKLWWVCILGASYFTLKSFLHLLCVYAWKYLHTLTPYLLLSNDVRLLCYAFLYF